MLFRMPHEGDGAHEDCLFLDYDVRAFSRFFGGSRAALSIEPRRVTFSLRRWRSGFGAMNPIPGFVHGTDPLVVISAALAPIGCWRVLLDQERLGTGAVAVRSRASVASLLEALRKADFQVEHHSTNVSVGRMISTESELELFRRSNQDRATMREGIGGGQQDRDTNCAARSTWRESLSLMGRRTTPGQNGRTGETDGTWLLC
jgi:hypothetical protein